MHSLSSFSFSVQFPTQKWSAKVISKSQTRKCPFPSPQAISRRQLKQLYNNNFHPSFLSTNLPSCQVSYSKCKMLKKTKKMEIYPWAPEKLSFSNQNFLQGITKPTWIVKKQTHFPIFTSNHTTFLFPESLLGSVVQLNNFMIYVLVSWHRTSKNLGISLLINTLVIHERSASHLVSATEMAQDRDWLPLGPTT